MADEGTSKESERWLSWRLALVVAGGLVVFGLVWWLVPLLLYRSGGTPDALLTAVTTTRAALLAGFVGLGALGTFWVNSRTLRITARTADVSARTLQVTEQGHLTDRYTKAIGQLGDDKLDIRLGGIYALERLAVDSERDHPTVVEVLSAFVRERSQGSAGITTDLQAALTVLGRLPPREGVRRGDLAAADLSGARLDGANLSGAQLTGASLAWASLNGTNLSGAQLDAVDLTGARLSKANLAKADLYEADLIKVDLFEADLTGAQLDAAKLTGSWLNRANLTGADLTDSDLTDTDLRSADLTGAQGLTDDQIASAQGDAATTLPDGVTRPASWT